MKHFKFENKVYSVDDLRIVSLETLDAMRSYFKETIEDLENKSKNASKTMGFLFIPIILPSYKEILSCIEREIVERTLLN